MKISIRKVIIASTALGIVMFFLGIIAMNSIRDESRSSDAAFLKKVAGCYRARGLVVKVVPPDKITIDSGNTETNYSVKFSEYKDGVMVEPNALIKLDINDGRIEKASSDRRDGIMMFFRGKIDNPLLFVGHNETIDLQRGGC